MYFFIGGNMSAINGSLINRYQTADTTGSPWQILVANRLKKDKTFYLNSHGEKQEYIYTWDRRTGDLYCAGDKIDDTKQIIQKKCLKVFAAAPFFSCGQILFHLGRILVSTAKIAFKALKEFGRVVYYQGIKRAFNVLWQANWVILKANLSYASEIARSIIFGLAVQGAAFYGLINPFEGRKWVAKIENHWQHGISWKKDIKIVENLKEAKVCYLAQCFQVRDNLNNPDLIIVRKGELL
jgi:hypothetical protein